jgi:hypothetical protein
MIIEVILKYKLTTQAYNANIRIMILPVSTITTDGTATANKSISILILCFISTQFPSIPHCQPDATSLSQWRGGGPSRTGSSVSTKVCSKCFVDEFVGFPIVCVHLRGISSHLEVEVNKRVLLLLRGGDRTIGKYQRL